MILAKTTAGQQALKDRSVPLSLRQRAALILVDGKRSIDEIRQATEAAPEDIAQLRTLQLVQLAGQAQAANEGSGVQRSDQELYAAAYPIAVRLTGELGLRGFRLNLAVEAASNFAALVDLAPKILEAVGVEKFTPLHRVLQAAR